ncbi:MAG: glycerol dehydrogenase [Theionarchaea archaeon]|nr:glycerol dehydrogenase [Theionarchaea archaeon]
MKWKILVSPSKYMQGPGILKECGPHIAHLGTHPFIIGGNTAYSLVADTLQQALEEEMCTVAGVLSDVRKCTSMIIGRGRQKVTQSRGDLILGVGGGSAVDTAKAVAYYLDLPVVTIPTVASTNADISAVSVIYDEQGKFTERIRLPENPRLAIVDTEILASAPPRFLASGMGDALSCRFEVEACRASGAHNHVGGSAPHIVEAVCTLCYDTLIEYGYQALSDVTNHCITPAFESVVEAIKLQSAIGFENGGNAAAHAIHNGFTRASPVQGSHGEIIAFCIIAQLFLEKKSPTFIETIARWCKDLALPVTLSQLSLEETYITAVSKESCATGSSIHNEPFPVSPDMVAEAILSASELGESLL